MVNKRTHIVIPEDLAAEIDVFVGKRKRSRFLIESARRELKRLRMRAALDEAAGAWKDEDHPELEHGSSAWVKQLRREDEERFRRITNRR